MANEKVFTIFMHFCLFLNLVFCEVIQEGIEIKKDCSTEEFQVISNVNSSDLSQKYSKDQIHNSYYCPSNDSTNLCVFSDDGLSKCGDIPHDILQCSSQGNISVLDCYCITYNKNEKEKLEVAYITVDILTQFILHTKYYQKIFQILMKLFVERNSPEMVHSVVSVKMDITLLLIPSI